MGKPPDYNPTVPNTGTIPENGTELEAYVGRENVVAVDGTPTASDAFPTDGRVAVDTTTDPDTYYIGDGTSWNEAGVGTVDNPDTLDLDASNQEHTMAGDARDTYVLVVTNGGASNANLQGLTGNAKNGCVVRIIAGATMTNAVVIEDNATGATDPFQTAGGTNETLSATGDSWIGVYTGSDWREVAVPV